MKQQTAVWLKGLFAALIGGAAGALTSGPIAGLLDPEHFNVNTGGGLGHMLTLMGAVALVSAISHLAFYLKQSPLPGFNADGQEVKSAAAGAIEGGK